MILEFFKINLYDKILKDFPYINDEHLHKKAYELPREQVITGGWVSEMIDDTGKILKILEKENAPFSNETRTVNLKGSPWVWDIRLGTILLVDTQSDRKDCWFLEQNPNNELQYRLAPKKTKFAIGCIINMPKKLETTNRLARLFKS